MSVQVDVNHRLNLFGYLPLAELDSELGDYDNAGMFELVLALEWVRDNIKNFRDDPRRVMFGLRGGGAKYATLGAMPSGS